MSEINLIVQELLKVPCAVVGSRGIGKSSLVKRIAKTLIDSGAQVLVLDNSGSWFLNSPLQNRIRVNLLNVESVELKPNTVYDVLQLEASDRLAFFASMCDKILKERADIKFSEGEEGLNRLPFLVIVLEESNTYLSSYSLSALNKATGSIKDFVSVGRNFKTSFIAVTTRSNELSTTVRERCNLLLGRITGSNEIQAIGRATNKTIREESQKLEAYTFLYYNGYSSVKFKPDYEQFPQPTTLINTVELMQTYRDLEIAEEKPRLNIFELIVKGYYAIIYIFIISVFLWIVL